MGYENTAGLGVSNQYGPRKAGGEEGVFLTDGLKNEYIVNLPSAGLKADGIAKADRGGVYVTQIDLNFVTAGTVTHIAVGGVAVYDSTTPVTLPVHLPAANTGKVVVTGGTAGNVVIVYEDLADAN